MKKIILSIAAVVIAASSVFAGFKPVEPSYEQSLQHSFRGAKAVKWSDDQGFTRATFEYGGSRTIAWFNSNGELLGYARNLSQQQLPLAVLSTLNKKYANADILESYEVSNELGCAYKISVNVKGKAYKLSFLSDGSLESVDKLVL